MTTDDEWFLIREEPYKWIENLTALEYNDKEWNLKRYNEKEYLVNQWDLRNHKENFKEALNYEALFKEVIQHATNAN